MSWIIETFNEDLKQLPVFATRELKQIAELFMGTESFNLRIKRVDVLTRLLEHLTDNLAFCSFRLSYNPITQLYTINVEVAVSRRLAAV